MELLVFMFAWMVSHARQWKILVKVKALSDEAIMNLTVHSTQRHARYPGHKNIEKNARDP